MIIRLPAYILIACMLCISCSAQVLRPIDIAKELFNPAVKQTFIDEHITGDYDGHPSGKDFPTDLDAYFLILHQTKKNAVVNMTIVDNKGGVTDKYLHFRKEDSRWKMHAIATPTLARMHRRIKDEMEAITPTQLDSLLAIYQHQENSPYKNKEEFSFMLNSLRLKVAPDDSLVAHFERHKQTFNQLLKEANATSKSPETETPTLVNTRTAAYSPLLISNVTTGGFLPAKCIDFHILNDQVGYLYTPKKKYLPELRPDKVMMLRSLGNGWYLYKVNIYL